MLTLTLHTQPDVPLELDGVTPDRLLKLAATTIARLPVAHGNRAVELGTFFAVTGDASDGDLRVVGDCSRVKLIGSGMTAGTLTVESTTLTLSGGSWSGGKYVIDVNQALTITTSSNFTGYETTGLGALIGLTLDGVQSDHHVSRIGPVGFTPDDDGISTNNIATFTIAAGTLTAGQDYEGWATFARVVDHDTTHSGVYAVAWWGNETSFTVSAIPEPSTYAAFAGLGALGLAVWRRRRAGA